MLTVAMAEEEEASWSTGRSHFAPSGAKDLEKDLEEEPMAGRPGTVSLDVSSLKSSRDKRLCQNCQIGKSFGIFFAAPVKITNKT